MLSRVREDTIRPLAQELANLKLPYRCVVVIRELLVVVAGSSILSATTLYYAAHRAISSEISAHKHVRLDQSMYREDSQFEHARAR